MKVGAIAAVSSAIPITIAASTPTTEDIEANLGHPLPEEAKKLLKAAVDNNENNAKERLKTKLPDCSEPCFGYRPTARGSK